MNVRLPVRVTAATAAALVAPTLLATTALAATTGGESRHAVANAQPDQVKGAKVRRHPVVRATGRGAGVPGRPRHRRARQAVAAVADPHSASYQHYLTPAQVKASYAPSAASVARTKAFLTGLRPERSARSRPTTRT